MNYLSFENNSKTTNNIFFFLGWCFGIITTCTYTTFLLPTTHKLLRNHITDIRGLKLLNNNKNNFYIDTFIDKNILKKFKNFMNNVNDNDDLYIYIKTSGGNYLDSLVICDMLLEHKGKTHAIINDYAYSCGLLCSLCCKCIYANKFTYFSPVDPMYNICDKKIQLSSVDIIFDKKNHNDIDDDTFLLNEQAIRNINVVKKYFDRIVKLHDYDKETEQKIFEELFEGKKNPHYINFSIKNLKSFGVIIEPLTQEMQKFSNLTYEY